MNKEKPQRIEITAQEITALIERVKQESLLKQDYPIVAAVLINYFAMDRVAQESAQKILRLVRMVFGSKTEKAKDVLKDEVSKEPSSNGTPKAEREPPEGEPASKEKVRGHGRNGASSYPGAEKVSVPHAWYKVGEGCPQCTRGKLYRFYEPGVEVRIVGRPPLEATVYEMEKLRCNLCGEIFTAQTPEVSGKDKYDETAGSMVALLKYGSGLPFLIHTCTLNRGNPFHYLPTLQKHSSELLEDPKRWLPLELPPGRCESGLTL